jgi:hypothetical protein
MSTRKIKTTSAVGVKREAEEAIETPVEGSKSKKVKKEKLEEEKVKAERGDDEEEVESGYNHDGVCDQFKAVYANRASFPKRTLDVLNKYPAATASFKSWKSWMPVYDYQKHLSPQSRKTREALQEFYATPGDLSDAWDDGWRWCLQPSNHQWYPPKWAYDANLVADVDVRNKADGGSVSSTVCLKVLLAMDTYRKANH